MDCVAYVVTLYSRKTIKNDVLPLFWNVTIFFLFLSISDIQYFLDTALSPYTSYSYYIEATNVHGSTRSAAVTYRTRPGVPEGSLNLSYITPVSSDSVTLIWTAPSNRSGPIEKYILSCAPLGGIQPCVPYEGHETSTTIWNLVPFTKYHFSVQACTSGGCLHSSPLTVTTAQAPPRRLGPPEVRTISATELHVEWSPPMEPNGRNSSPQFPFLGQNMNEITGIWNCAMSLTIVFIFITAGYNN